MMYRETEHKLVEECWGRIKQQVYGYIGWRHEVSSCLQGYCLWQLLLLLINCSFCRFASLFVLYWAPSVCQRDALTIMQKHIGIYLKSVGLYAVCFQLVVVGIERHKFVREHRKFDQSVVSQRQFLQHCKLGEGSIFNLWNQVPWKVNPLQCHCW